MTEQRLAEWIAERLDRQSRVRRTESFRDAGLLTRDTGLEVRLVNGQVFQITVQEATRQRG